MITIGTEIIFSKNDFTAIGTFDYLSGDFHTATWAYRSGITNLATALRPFYHCHNFICFYQLLLMSESYFSESVTSHEPTFVDVRVNAVDTSLSRVLPHCDGTAVIKLRFTYRVL